MSAPLFSYTPLSSEDLEQRTRPIVACAATWDIRDEVREDLGRGPRMWSRVVPLTFGRLTMYSCLEPSLGGDEPYCEYHWLDMK